jgi:ATP/maltotriose-dependent transcriptional regulator MalT
VAGSLILQVQILQEQGRVNAVLDVLDELEEVSHTLHNDELLVTVLGNKADLHYDQGAVDSALELYRQQERLCRRIDRPQQLAWSLMQQALILQTRYNLQASSSVAEEALALATKHGYTEILQRIHTM